MQKFFYRKRIIVFLFLLPFVFSVFFIKTNAASWADKIFGKTPYEEGDGNCSLTITIKSDVPIMKQAEYSCYYYALQKNLTLDLIRIDDYTASVTLNYIPENTEFTLKILNSNYHPLLNEKYSYNSSGGSFSADFYGGRSATARGTITGVMNITFEAVDKVTYDSMVKNGEVSYNEHGVHLNNYNITADSPSNVFFGISKEEISGTVWSLIGNSFKDFQDIINLINNILLGFGAVTSILCISINAFRLSTMATHPTQRRKIFIDIGGAVVCVILLGGIKLFTTLIITSVI